MRKKMSDAESDRLFRLHHPNYERGMTFAEIAELLIAEIRTMDNDQRAHLRASMLRSAGTVKSADGKPN